MNHLTKLRTHLHDCKYKPYGCSNQIECSDMFLERNYDGWPEVICRLNQDNSIPCDECLEADYCPDCGAPLHLMHEDGCEYYNRTEINENDEISLMSDPELGETETETETETEEKEENNNES